MKYTKSILRGLSVGRIVLAAMTPGVSYISTMLPLDTHCFNVVYRNILADFSDIWLIHKLGYELRRPSSGSGAKVTDWGHITLEPFKSLASACGRNRCVTGHCLADDFKQWPEGTPFI